MIKSEQDSQDEMTGKPNQDRTARMGWQERTTRQNSQDGMTGKNNQDMTAFYEVSNVIYYVHATAILNLKF
jgi:hypothetical protein